MRFQRRTGGFTLVEMLTSMAVGLMLLATLIMIFLYSSRSFVAISNYVDLNIVSRNALDKMTREIRQVSALTAFQTNELIFNDLNGITLKYSWSPTTRELTRESPVGSTPEVLLRNCDSLVFHMFQRAPRPGTNNFTPTGNVAQCKLISVNWRCSRFLFDKKVNTENVQTTEIVLRNKS